MTSDFCLLLCAVPLSSGCQQQRAIRLVLGSQCVWSCQCRIWKKKKMAVCRYCFRLLFTLPNNLISEGYICTFCLGLYFLSSALFSFRLHSEISTFIVLSIVMSVTSQSPSEKCKGLESSLHVPGVN